MELSFASFKLLFGIFLHSLQLFKILFSVIQLIFQCIDNILISFFHRFSVLSM